MGEVKKYDVFINHGLDTKNNLASLIHRRLEGFGRRVFLDKTELDAEDHLYNTVKSAISSSAVHVAIFSVRYAESSLCLNELLDMLQPDYKIIPIFYDIKPAELRDIEKGHYAEAFLKHQENHSHDMKLVERWKDALKEASLLISGMEFNTTEDDLGYVVEEIVEKVLKEVKGELLHVAEHPVGLHDATEDFNNFLKERQLSGATVVGIIGPHGSGKSTLARHLYNYYMQSRKYKKHCLLSELNENDLAVLRQQLVRDLLGDDKYSINDTTKGKRELQTCLKGCGSVLIVLDGLDKEEQIENLLLVEKEDDLAEGSLILVTCHDKTLLAGHQVNLFYHVKLLQGEDARDLFCWYAFGERKPPKDLEDLVEKFLKICRHFPLALKVLGQQLSLDQDPRYWEEQLEDLVRQESPTNIVDNLLEASCSYLGEREKEVFLEKVLQEAKREPLHATEHSVGLHQAAEEGACAVYHVFINHRGPDTKKTVASLIYRGLIKYGLRVFLDQGELEVGDSLCQKIKNTISSSSVHIAIFSLRYAESAWCLNELSDMLQSGCKIIPIFYDVKPAHLRHIENGPYAKAFRKHQDYGKYAMELVEKWKHALRKASYMYGLEFITEKGDLGDLVEEIVEKVLKEAKLKPLYVAEYPVGLHHAAEDFNKFLKEKQLSDTTVVGITGLDGSGKSTLVTYLYNFYLQGRKFKRYCFLNLLNEKNLPVLQQKMVLDLLGVDKYSISDTTTGKSVLQTCLKGCGPVLIVLDGLDEAEQIKSLLSVMKKDVLAEGSLILVTCHNKALLKAYQVDLFYEVKLLRGKDGHDLFCWYAFGSSEHPSEPLKPPKHLDDLVEKFLEICCGFPLALEVLGRKLYGEQDRRYWKELLEDLRRSLPADIVDKILEVSYNSLEEREKEVFLDVAHFLVGEDTDLAVRVLEGLHGNGLKWLKDLQSKCLLDLEEIEHCKRPFAKGTDIQWRTKGSSKIRMHNLVREMATQIAMDIEHFDYSLPTKPLRLCQSKNKCIFQQRSFSRGRHVRGILCEDIDEPKRQEKDTKKPRLSPQSLTGPNPNMDGEISGLRLLVLYNCRDRFSANRLCGDLVWLRMHKSRWDNTIPSTLSLQNLRVLELDGVQLEALGSMDGDKFPWKLCELTVDYSGVSAEGSNVLSSSRVGKNSMEASSSASGSFWDWFIVRELMDFVKMVLKNVRGLNSLPIDFELLRNLRHLDLSGCSDLEKMPASFTKLLQLQYLALQDCMSLSISDLGEITKLEYLDFEGCSLLRKLPDKTTAQRGLKYLNLMGTSIEELPQDFGELKKLEQLLISSSYLRSLPDSFCELGRLRILTLSGCFDLRDISRSIPIEQFPCLESLQLWDVGVTAVPQGIAWSRVKVLRVKARYLSEISFERDQGNMWLDGSDTQGSIHDRTKSSLTELTLVETDISELWLPSEGGLFPDLEIVDLSGNHRLRDVQSLSCDLKRLSLKNCTALTTLSCLSKLKCLKILDISGCSNLGALSLEGLTSIEEIAAKDCFELQSIQGLANPACIRILDISGCRKLKALNLEGRRSIEEIAAKDCFELQSTQGLANTCIRILDISGCHKLKVLNLEGLRSIEEIKAKECFELQIIQGLANTCIRILDISGCHKLEVLNLEGLRSIEEIKAKECFELQSIQGLAELHTLSFLNFSTFHEDTNSTIWSEILGFLSNVSTVILGGANVCMNAEEMDSVIQSISNEFRSHVRIIEIPIIRNKEQVRLEYMKSYKAILLCFITKKHFLDFKVSVDDNVYTISRPCLVKLAEVREEHEEIPWLYIFMWSQNSNLFKDLKLHDKRVVDCTIQLCDYRSGSLEMSFTKAWIMKFSESTEGVQICKQLFTDMCGIPVSPKQAVHQAVAL